MKKQISHKLPVMLKDLKLPIMLQSWQVIADKAIEEKWTYPEYLATLSELEVNNKYERRISRMLKESKILPHKDLTTFNFSTNKSINKQQVLALSNDTSWVKNGDNVIIIGPSGVGKTHLAMAISNRLIEHNIRVLFFKTTTLAQHLQAAKKRLELPKEILRLNKYDVLILDDIGYVKKDSAESSVLFELITERYESKSIVITCNQPFSEWNGIFSDEAMTVAAVDRLVHHAVIMNIKGASYRRQECQKKN